MGLEQKNQWSRVRELLCIRLDGIGDVVMTSPAFRALKDNLPGCRLTLLCSPAGAAAASLIPELDDVIVYGAPWMKATGPRRNGTPDLEMVRLLRDLKFDGAVIFTVYSQNPMAAAFLCHLSDIPLRLAHCRENPYQMLTHWVPEPEPQAAIRHEVRRQLDLVESVGFTARKSGIRLRVPEGARRRVMNLLSKKQIDLERPWIVFHPGASAPSRRYPAALCAAAARRLSREGIGIFFTGSESEKELVDSVRSEMAAPSESFAGELSLEELAALLEMAPAAVINNTGPAHIAAGVGTPVVSLYALTNPQHVPWGVSRRVLFHEVKCKFCYKSVCPEGHQDCLSRVSPDRVVQAVHELLREGRGPREEDAESAPHGAVEPTEGDLACIR
jgi:lipopolysaccharide heptosyltransferase II